MTKFKGTGRITLTASNTSRQINTFAATYDDYPKAAINNAKRALSIREDKDNTKIQECGERTGWARANQLAKGEVLSRETVARMASFKRHQKNKTGNPTEDCGALMWLAWGGDEGIEWAINKMQEIREEEQEEFSKLGFKNTKLDHVEFASSLGEMTVPEDVQVREEDLLLVPFRLISATIVGAYSWKATDFSDAKVLRNSMRKLLKKPVYTQHFADPDNAIGFVKDVVWTNAYMQNGVEVPAGIDGVLAIDTVGDRKESLARGIQMGAIHSNSVSVEFEWKASHDFQNEYDFLDAIGSVVDGKMVTRVVTKVVDFFESSLVDLGADPYAKIIDSNGNLINIEEGATITQYKKDNKTKEVEYALSNIHSFSATLSYNKQTNKMKHKLKGKFGAALSKMMEEAIESKMAKEELSREDVINALSDAAGVTVKTIGNILAAKSNCPTMARMEAFASVLGLSIESVLESAEIDGCITADADLAAAKDDKEEMMEDKEEYMEEEEEDEMEEEMMEDKDKKDMGKDCGCEGLKKQLEETKAAFAKAIEAHKEEVLKFKQDLAKEATNLKEVRLSNVTLKAESESYSKLVEQHDTLKAEYSALKAKENFIEVGEKYQENLTKRVIESYKKQAGSNFKESMVKLFESANLEQLEELAGDVNESLFEKFSYSCASCGHNKANFGSVRKSAKSSAPAINKEDVITDEDLRKEFSKDK